MYFIQKVDKQKSKYKDKEKGNMEQKNSDNHLEGPQGKQLEWRERQDCIYTGG